MLECLKITLDGSDEKGWLKDGEKTANALENNNKWWKIMKNLSVKWWKVDKITKNR